ncbi:uncharacterized protein BDR25DRAFT_82272 [Lindgomyces ingoldianus]|uniref:Uncharacterized protein n=1 Tax=Lindgomyces ingoldianus TaxID=673940 RepID=A0ACB6QFI0_9PLEO|nr:uncharacterized protein BDR25DRAFT_82272 [Lindgomyces ingoldianus]KAF2465684.1 hypothetical protein BDR25DRAFT_82272 [Lindgomyces ingoldianus]
MSEPEYSVVVSLYGENILSVPHKRFLVRPALLTKSVTELANRQGPLIFRALASCILQRSRHGRMPSQTRVGAHDRSLRT